MVGTTDIIIPIVCWEVVHLVFFSPQAPSGLTCVNGLSGLAFSDDIVLSSGWVILERNGIGGKLRRNTF